MNRIARAVAQLALDGESFDDLTESNPTRCGFRYPPRLLEALTSPLGLRYDPAPLGLPVAREAVAHALQARALGVDPAQIVVTASTSDAYGLLFKLLCDAGSEVAVPQPSYPLLEHLARLESVRRVAYPLEFHGRWSVNQAALGQAVTSKTRAVVVVNPNNPTGSFHAHDDLEGIVSVCRERGLALIADEVFGWYPMSPAARRGPSVLDRPAEVLTFVLGGLSKAVGLPQLKLGWIAVDGPARLVKSALERLEHVADTYLGVATPVQLAAGTLLERGEAVTSQIADRIRENNARLRALVADQPAVTRLPVDGGWYAVVQVPGMRSEEQLVLELLERERVLVHPGYFFDFPREAFLVMSLLTEPDVFARAVRRALVTAVSQPESTPRPSTAGVGERD